MDFNILKKLAKHGFESLGYYVRKTRGLPIGVDSWYQLRTRFEIQPQSIWDVGGHRGETVGEIRSQFPEANVHSFEPFPENFNILESKFSDDPFVTCHNVAMGSRDSEMDLFVHADSQTHSLVPSDTARNKMRVPVRTIDSVLQTHPTDSIDILKIDTEGFELDVLIGASAAISSGRISLIVREASLQPDDLTHSSLIKLQEFLLPHDYFLWGVFDQVAWTSPHRLAYFNAVFVLKRDQ